MRSQLGKYFGPMGYESERVRKACTIDAQVLEFERKLTVVQKRQRLHVKTFANGQKENSFISLLLEIAPPIFVGTFLGYAISGPYKTIGVLVGFLSGVGAALLNLKRWVNHMDLQQEESPHN